MSGYVLTVWSNVVSRTDGAIAGASARKLLSTYLTKTVPGAGQTGAGTLVDYVWSSTGDHRSGVKITAYAAIVYLKYVPFGTANTGVACSSTDYDDAVPIGTTLSFGIPKSLDVIIFTSGNFSAAEFN